MLRQLSLPGLFLAAALAFVAAPDTRIAASSCSGPGTDPCKINEVCLNLLFYKHCTTTIDYYAERDPFRIG